jgi:hypothetical protein
MPVAGQICKEHWRNASGTGGTKPINPARLRHYFMRGEIETTRDYHDDTKARSRPEEIDEEPTKPGSMHPLQALGFLPSWFPQNFFSSSSLCLRVFVAWQCLPAAGLEIPVHDANEPARFDTPGIVIAAPLCAVKLA